jgi:predicted nucleic acid-binding Zn ribbon protein
MNNEQILKEVIKEFMNSFNIKDKITEVHINESWEMIMGKVISRHTINIYLKEKTLFITLDSAALRQELSYAKTKMINMLNKELGGKVIDEIILR